MKLLSKKGLSTVEEDPLKSSTNLFSSQKLNFYTKPLTKKNS